MLASPTPKTIISLLLCLSVLAYLNYGAQTIHPQSGADFPKLSRAVIYFCIDDLHKVVTLSVIG